VRGVGGLSRRRSLPRPLESLARVWCEKMPGSASGSLKRHHATSSPEPSKPPDPARGVRASAGMEEALRAEWGGGMGAAAGN
jgi:hypothetical protein